MSEPGLQFEQRHRLLGVVELAGDRRARPVAGDVAAEVSCRDTCLGAERGDQGAVDVVPRDRVRADGEQQVHLLAGLAIGPCGLLGPQRLPGLDGLTDQGVDGLGEGGAGLVHRDVEQADGVLDEDVGGVTGDGCPSCRQRMQPTRSREISSLRRPENSQVRARARMSASG